MRVKDAVGRFGEQLAAEHLRGLGLEVLARNWRCRDGELDIVARTGGTLVVVEVKTRSSLAYGGPGEAVDHRKADRIRRLALLWVDEQRRAGVHGHWATIRFDVVCVLRRRSAPAELTHLVGAF